MCCVERRTGVATDLPRDDPSQTRHDALVEPDRSLRLHDLDEAVERAGILRRLRALHLRAATKIHGTRARYGWG